MRKIDADALEQKLSMLGVSNAYDRPSFWYGKDKKDYKVIPTKYHKGYDNALADVEKAIQELPTIEEPIWHPYPQEKPKVDGDYNVTLKYSKCTATANYDTENDEWRGGNDFYVPNRCITAWVELPEPYKGSEAK